MMSDLRAALRILFRNPGWAAAVVLTLAIGIGANTAVFSVIEALVLRPLPFRDPEELVFVDAIVGAEPGHVSKREFRELLVGSQVVEEYAGYYPSQYQIVDPPAALVSTIGTSNLFSLLGAPMKLGSAWDPAIDFRRAYEVVLSHRLWQQRYGGRADIVGQSVLLDGGSYRVAGVLDRGFDYPVRTEVFRSITDYDGDHLRRLWVIGRLREGRSIADLQGELDRLSTHFEQLYPDTNRAVRLRARPLANLYLGAARPYLLLLSPAVLLLLLLACANVTNLLLSRALSRSGEIAVRTAVGATWNSLVRLSLCEAAVLVVPGAVLGLAAAYWVVPSLMAMVRTDLPEWFDVRVDGATLIFTLVVAVLTALVVSVAPALQARRLSIETTLRQESSRGIGGRGSQRWRAGLVGAQVALATVLLIAATVFAIGTRNLQRVELGFDPEGLATFRTDPPYSRYGTIAQISAFYRQAIDRLKERPGVTDAASNQRIPMATLDAASPRVRPEGESEADAISQPFVNFQIISPGYFDVMRIPLVTGRRFNDFDSEQTEPVAIVSMRTARRLWGEQDPLGQRFSMTWNQTGTSASGGQSILMTVVGVAGDVRANGVQEEPGLDVYAPHTQTFAGDSFFVMRTALDPAVVATEIPRALAAVDPQQSHFDVVTMSDRVAASMWQQRVAGAVLMAFAVVAFVLAVIGVHAVTSHAVAMRRAELCVRLALGAEPGAVVAQTVADALRPAWFGAVVGAFGGIGAAVIIGRLLPVGLGPASAAGAVILGALLAVAAGAAAVPTFRTVRSTALPALLR